MCFQTTQTIYSVRQSINVGHSCRVEPRKCTGWVLFFCVGFSQICGLMGHLLVGASDLTVDSHSQLEPYAVHSAVT